MFSCCVQDTLRDCAHDTTTTCYNTVVSPIYFVSFVLTAQFVLVNVVIAVLMKHLEESNKEAKEEAELEAELELENRLQAEEMATRSPQLNPMTPGMDRSSSGGSPWRSTGGGDREQEMDGPMDSPTADITRDTVNIRAEAASCLDTPLEVIHIFLFCLSIMCALSRVYFVGCGLKVFFSMVPSSSVSKTLLLCVQKREFWYFSTGVFFEYAR